MNFVPTRALVLAFLALALFATLGVTGDVAQARGERSDVIITFAGPPNASDQAAVRGAGGEIGGGAGAELETTVNTLNATATAMGAVVIAETDGVDFNNVSTTDGNITLSAGGDSTATSVVAG
ncbi:MAG: hypothetical protein IIC30_03170, partial [Chloroflexi bacterium]|nr:hypothetical protein [Chloroflexota bacterium]